MSVSHATPLGVVLAKNWNMTGNTKHVGERHAYVEQHDR